VGGSSGPAGASGAAAGASGGTTAPDAGVAGAGAAGTAGATETARPSLGCNKAPAIAKGQFVSAPLMGRTTWVRLPASYDPSRAYPLVFVWKGCSAAGITAYGMDTVAGNEAIIAQGDFPPGAACYDTADGAKFVDLPVFDALLQDIETKYCVDQNHVFSVGFSSGAWLTFFLGCQRGDVLRGIGTVAGGLKPTFFLGAATCKGTGNSAFMVSDLDDHENPFFDEDHDGDSVEIGVNHWLDVNGCTEKAWTMTNGQPSEPDPNLCRTYTGCGRNPVRLCLTHGIGHDPQQKLSMPGFWQLFKTSLPKP
jgi:poly(3-hydroxybutyrate) depolymerase